MQNLNTEVSGVCVGHCENICADPVDKADIESDSSGWVRSKVKKRMLHNT